MTNPEAVSLVSYPNLDPRLRVFRAGKAVDSFALLAQRYIVLVDTLVTPEAMGAAMDLLLASIPEADRRPLLVINTHGDWDHVWGNALFAAPDAPYPAPIIGSTRTADLMSSPEAAEFLASFKQENPGRYDSAAFWPPTIRFEQSLRIDGGDLTLELFPTVGHTPDHSAVWVPEIRLLLAGDAAEMPFPFVSERGSLPDLRASLQAMADLEPETVLYCHAPGVTDAGLILQNIAYFDELERRCRAALNDGADLEGDDPPARLGWPLEAALPPGVAVADLPFPQFYRMSHETNVRTMITWCQALP